MSTVHIRLTFIGALLISSIALALGPSAAASAQSACECYQAGRSGQSRPDGCTAHIMGPMTPWLGGHYDRRDNNSRYLDGNDWCSPDPMDSGWDSGSRFGETAPPRYTSHQIDRQRACSCGYDSAFNMLFVGEGAERCMAGARYSCQVGYSGLAGWGPLGGNCSAQDYCQETVSAPDPDYVRPLTLDPDTSSSSSGENSCRWAFDGVCDGPSICDPGTDTADCANSCVHANDGVCDEPQYCEYGTDTDDCS